MSDKEQPWERVLAHARIKKHVYSATFFSTRSTSIVDQQTRCFNLCYALSASGEVKKKSHVGIVGSGVSGMTCAVALAMLRDCLVYVFEQDNMVLQKFREAAFRYIHPDLNPGDTLYRYDPHKKTKFPFMNWSGNYAPLVAEEITRKFDHYRAVSNIALFLNEEVEAMEPKGRSVKIRLARNQLLTFDTVIIASGFGKEKKPSSYTSDFSYWHSGNPDRYQPPQLRSRGRKKERVLISGNGDSGVIELAHLLIRDFNHRDIFTYLPTNDVPLLADHFFDTVRALRFRHIEEGNENFPELSGPISWYWGIRVLLEDNPELTFFDLVPQDGRLERNIYQSIDCRLSSCRRPSAIGSRLVVEIEKCLDPFLDKLASYEIARLVENYKLERIFAPAIRDRFHQDFVVTMIGRTPTIYSRRQAPLNWFLLRVFERYGRFKYRSAELPEGQRPRMERGRIRVVLKGKSPTVAFFDRIIVRHGPDYEVLGYKKGLGYKNDIENTQSQYGRTQDPVFGDVAPFRTPRWKKAVRTPTIIHDDGVLGFTGRNPDPFLLALSEFGLHRTAGKLYREAKKAKRSLDAIKQMVKLSLAISEKVGTSHNKAVHQTCARTARDRRR